AGIAFCGLALMVLGAFLLSLLKKRVRKVVYIFAVKVIKTYDAIAFASYLKICEILPLALHTEGMMEFHHEHFAATTIQRWIRSWLLIRDRRAQALPATIADLVVIEKVKKQKELEALEYVEPDPVSVGKRKSRKKREPSETSSNAFQKKPASSARSRKILFSTGSSDTFRRMARTNVLSGPGEPMKLEVDLEKDGPVFGAFVKARACAVKYSVLTGGLECAIVTRVVPCSLAERHGIRSGFYLIRVGRYGWPDFPGSRLVKELESGKRPLYLVLEEQQTFTPDLGDEEDQLPPQAPPPGQLEVAPPPHGEPPLRPWLHEEEAPAAPVTRPPPLNHGDSWPSEAAVLNAALESPSGQSRPSASPSRGFFRAATLPIPGNESSSDFVPPGAAPPDRKRRFPGRPRPTSAGSSQSQLRMAEARQSQELRPSSASA
ncbi:unnamed protein product, partial [Polarella glacialis]